MGPKIKLYLFAVAYLVPTHTFTPYPTFCFAFPEVIFFFAVSIFQFESEMLNLYKLTRKNPIKISFNPSLFIFFSFVMAALFIYFSM